MLNERLQALGEGPFQRLGALLADIRPAVNRPSFNLAVGEPRHPYPEFVAEILDANRHLYGRYPQVGGTPEYRAAAADWLTRRYRLPAGMIEPDRHVLPLAGTREGLFLIALVVTPSEKGGGGALVLMPNPFYHPYAGAALAAGGEPRFLPARAPTGFMPAFEQVSE